MHLKGKFVQRTRSMKHDNPVAIFGSSVPAHWLPGVKLSPFLDVFSQACVIGQSQSPDCQEKWSLVRPSVAVFLKCHFILKHPGEVAHYAGKTTRFLLSLAAILFSYDLFFWEDTPCYLTAFILKPRAIFYFPSMVCLSWMQDQPETLSLCFSFSSTSVQTPDHKKKIIQGAIKLYPSSLKPTLVLSQVCQEAGTTCKIQHERQLLKLKSCHLSG